MSKGRKIHEDLEAFLDKDREDEIQGLEEYTEDDFAFMKEMQGLIDEFN